MGVGLEPQYPQPPAGSQLPPRRTWWGRLLNWEKVLLIGGAVVVILAVIGGVVALNVAESRMVGTTTPTPGSDVSSPETEGTTLPTVATVPYDWITFEGESISLDLPDFFQGGKPTDAAVVSMLEEWAALNPNVTAGLSVEEYLQRAGLELLMFGRIDEFGSITAVSAAFEEVPSTVSLESYAQAMAASLVDAELTVERVTEDRAYCVLSARPYEGARVNTTRFVFIRADSRIYSVGYATVEGDSGAMDSIFEISAETIVVRAPATIIMSSL